MPDARRPARHFGQSALAQSLFAPQHLGVELDSVSGPWCQRWRTQRVSWRHRSEGGFDRSRYEVAEIPDDTTARAFVLEHHYARSYPAAIRRYGLYRNYELVGVAVLSAPVRKDVLTMPFPELVAYSESLELGRFVLLDEVEANGESFFLGQLFRLAASAGIRGVVSFSDPMARTDISGRQTFVGHAGIIYQATNAAYLGRGTARSLLLLPDGTVLNARALQKVRQLEKGHQYVEKLLVDLGGRPRAVGEDGARWLREQLSQLPLRRLRHPGNHRYAFRLGPRRKLVRIGLPAHVYPKPGLVAA